MKIQLSPAEIGAIIYAIQSVYQDGTEESALAQRLADEVYKTLGDDYIDAWISEFEIDIF